MAKDKYIYAYYTGVSNVEKGSWIEQSEQVVNLS